MHIQNETIEGTTYYTIESRGVIYTIYFCDASGAWCVLSRRKSLGRRNMGTVRYFDTLEQVEQKIKGLFGIYALLGTIIKVDA